MRFLKFLGVGIAIVVVLTVALLVIGLSVLGLTWLFRAP